MLVSFAVRHILPSTSRSRSLISVARSGYSYRLLASRHAQAVSISWLQQHAQNLHRCQHHLAHEDGKDGKDAATTLKPPVAKKKRSFLNFVYSRFLKFLDHYQKLLEKKFPGAMNVYRVFVVGFKDFSVETKDYVMIKRRIIMDSTQLIELSRNEIDTYYRMPGEIMRVGPTLLISALPFANYVVFPIAYYFPKRLLSCHFWSLEQKSQFAQEFHKQKLVNYRPLLRHLQLNVDDIFNKNLKDQFQDALHQLGSGFHPSASEILQFKLLFEKDRYSLKAIHGPHVNSLCRIHGIHRLYLNRRRLYDRAEMLRVLDTIIVRDGINDLKPEELKTACFLRGLNGANLDNTERRKYLEEWLSVSLQLDSRANSLLLHLPIFLTYNHPNNWGLLKS